VKNEATLLTFFNLTCVAHNFFFPLSFSEMDVLRHESLLRKYDGVYTQSQNKITHFVCNIPDENGNICGRKLQARATGRGKQNSRLDRHIFEVHHMTRPAAAVAAAAGNAQQQQQQGQENLEEEEEEVEAIVTAAAGNGWQWSGFITFIAVLTYMWKSDISPEHCDSQHSISSLRRTSTLNEREFCDIFQCPTGGVCQNLNDGYECVTSATFNGVNTTLRYFTSDDFNDLHPTISFRFRSRRGGTVLVIQN